MKVNIFTRIRKAIETFRAWQPQTIDELDRLIEEKIAGKMTQSGQKVNELIALNVSAIWCANLIISQTIASLPLITYIKKDTNKERIQEASVYKILHDSPNPEMSSFQFRETMQTHLNLSGNCYAEIVRDENNQIVALFPLFPDRITIDRNEKKELIYKYKLSDGQEIIFPKKDIFHIANLSWDGRNGFNVVAKAADSIGLALAQESYSNNYFRNSATPPGILKHPGRFGKREEAIANIRKAWDYAYSGSSNAGKVVILEEGMEYTPISFNPEQSQLLGSRLFSIEEICRWFNIPPHKLKDLTHATFSNIEQQQIEFVQDTIRPICVRWEAEIKRQLLGDNDIYSEFLLDALLRGDSVSRNNAYAIMRQWGIINADEWRAKENLNELPDDKGKDYLIPLNYMAVGDEAPKKEEKIAE